VRGVGWALAIFVAGFSALASAQDKTVDRTAQGQAGKDVRVGVYVLMFRTIAHLVHCPRYA
jgi:hypothetical protein